MTMRYIIEYWSIRNENLFLRRKIRARHLTAQQKVTLWQEATG